MSSHRRIEPASAAQTLLVALAAALALFAVACGGDDGAAAAGTGGQTAPAVAPGVAPTAGGGQFDFGDLEGSPAMLWFWAPW